MQFVITIMQFKIAQKKMPTLIDRHFQNILNGIKARL